MDINDCPEYNGGLAFDNSPHAKLGTRQYDRCFY